jgi:hypothetical protein
MYVQRIRRTLLISTSQSEFFLQCGLYHRTRHSRGIEREARLGNNKGSQESGREEGAKSYEWAGGVEGREVGGKKKGEIEEGEEWKWTEGGEKTEKRERENK